MPRPPKCRRIAAEPPVSAFKPAGVPGRDLQVVELGLDELEAIRLADLEGLYHDAAAARMGISRPTFGRLIEGARHKVASALLNAKMLVFQGGPIVTAPMRSFVCADCEVTFHAPFGTGRPPECPRCHGRNFHRALEEGEPGGAGPQADAQVSGPRGRGRCNRRRRRWARLNTSTPDTAGFAEDAE